MRRVLFVNWVDYLDPEGRGGGVSVYQRNLMAELAARPGIEAIFLASGISHDITARAPRWERIRHGPGTDRARRFEIVNSGVMAPAHHSFGDPAQLSHPATEAAFFDFLRATGPYDAVHFNNLEGLPASVLRLKEIAPGTRVVFMLHNYYPVCPQVNLWHRERHSCEDFAGGRACVDCLPHRPDPRLIRLANGVAYRLKCLGIAPGGRGFDPLFRWGMRILRRIRGGARTRPDPAIAGDAHAFAARRRAMVKALNTHCDAVLCVSDAVRDLAIRYGIAPERARTCRIGTREAEAFHRTAPRGPLPRPDGSLTLAYLGYMRRDKGFFFLLDALETLPLPLSRRLRLVVAARRGEAEAMTRLAALGQRLGGLLHHDGYAHDGLDALLAQVDVGVVPVLWHDNLPQVAIEMHARHIPLLTSDMGGAQELGNCPEMVFVAGDAAAFHDRIAALLSGRIDTGRYWQNARPPVTMAAHVAELAGHYGWS
ncbi:MAG: glycosyltransferase [Roseovarius sp.]|nr:glycosyltransferase [Roseovarius sp.]